MTYSAVATTALTVGTWLAVDGILSLVLYSPAPDRPLRRLSTGGVHLSAAPLQGGVLAVVAGRF